MNWTTSTPTQPGYYWLRNARTRFGVQIEPQIVQIGSLGASGDRLRVLSFGAMSQPPRIEDVAGEWCGPILPPDSVEEDSGTER